MTTASGVPYRIGGAQVTCPLCSTPLVTSTSEPATAGGTALTVARCPACPWVMLGADPALSVRVVECSQADALAQFEAARYDADARLSLTVERPATL